MMGLAVEHVSATDRPFRDALAEAGLPIDDLAEQDREFLRFGLNSKIVGYGGRRPADGVTQGNLKRRFRFLGRSSDDRRPAS